MNSLFDVAPPIPVLSDGMSLREARRWLREHAADGTDCPCCTQFFKTYKVKLNSGMARGMCHLARYCLRCRPEGGWVHISRELQVWAGENFNKLEYSRWHHFDLLEGNPLKPGYYRLTQLGNDFVGGTAEVPRVCFVLLNKRVAVGDEKTTIRKALGDHFDYDELMGR